MSPGGTIGHRKGELAGRGGPERGSGVTIGHRKGGWLLYFADAPADWLRYGCVVLVGSRLVVWVAFSCGERVDLGWPAFGGVDRPGSDVEILDLGLVLMSPYCCHQILRHLPRHRLDRGEDS